MVLTDGTKTCYTPAVKVSNVSSGKAGVWLWQIGDRQEFGNFELSRTPFAPAIKGVPETSKQGWRVVGLGAGLPPMARKIRIEYAGAAYHVMARGNQGRDIYDDDRDRTVAGNAGRSV